MFCSKCGAKIENQDKFCPKCGNSIAGPLSSEKKEEKNDKKTAAITPAPVRNKSCLSCLFSFFAIAAIFALISVLIYSGSAKNRSTELIIGAIVFSFTFFVLGVWGLISLNRKNKLAHQNETIATSSKQKKNCANSFSVIISIVLIIIVTIIVIASFGNSGNKSGEKTETTTKPAKTPTASKSWDGNYNAKMTKPNCDSSVEFTSFQVVDNAVVNNWGKNAPIGSDGRATIIMDTGTKMTTNLTFTESGVSGSWETSKGCSGTLTATRSSSWF